MWATTTLSFALVAGVFIALLVLVSNFEPPYFMRGVLAYAWLGLILLCGVGIILGLVYGLWVSLSLDL